MWQELPKQDWANVVMNVPTVMTSLISVISVEKFFFTLTHYTDHVVSHAKGEGHVCTSCKRSFRNASNMKKKTYQKSTSDKQRLCYLRWMN